MEKLCLDLLQILMLYDPTYQNLPEGQNQRDIVRDYNQLENGNAEFTLDFWSGDTGFNSIKFIFREVDRKLVSLIIDVPGATEGQYQLPFLESLTVKIFWIKILRTVFGRYPLSFNDKLTETVRAIREFRRTEIRR